MLRSIAIWAIALCAGGFMSGTVYAQNSQDDDYSSSVVYPIETSPIQAAPVQSQRKSSETSRIPPLPQIQPQLSPPTAQTESLSDILAPEERGLAGWTGFGYGSSSIGSGQEILTDPEEMDLRSTSIDLGLIQPSDAFEMPAVASDERWIRVDLGNQQVVAYTGEQPQRAFIVSTGLPNFQTVTGEFRVRMKVSEQTMSGDDFYLPGVKWVQYFYSEYAFHGTYWHSDFGIPKSHGCVNMTNADAKWLFDWAGPVWDGETVWYRPTDDNPGTLVIVHK